MSFGPRESVSRSKKYFLNDPNTPSDEDESEQNADEVEEMISS